MAHARGAKVVTVIHDLGAFRAHRLTTAQETARLNHSDYVIADNPVMKRWLESNGCRAKVGSLGIFDYLSGSRPNGGNLHRKPFTVVYAGGLNRRKNAFLYDWGECIGSYGVRVYGNGFEPGQAKGADRFEAMGFVSSDELIATVRGDFGLIWDGPSLDECTGTEGGYLKINTPHKTSLYMRCGLPIIIWSQAAMAQFVRDNGVGLCIYSLRQLDGALRGVTEKEYLEMAARAKAIGERLAAGGQIRAALAEAVACLEGKAPHPNS